VWKSAGSQSATRMRDELPRALSDTSLQVRLEAASAVTVYALSAGHRLKQIVCSVIPSSVIYVVAIFSVIVSVKLSV